VESYKIKWTSGQVDLLPYPNRKLKTRAKEWLAESLFDHFEENS